LAETIELMPLVCLQNLLEALQEVKFYKSILLQKELKFLLAIRVLHPTEFATSLIYHSKRYVIEDCKTLVKIYSGQFNVRAYPDSTFGFFKPDCDNTLATENPSPGDLLPMSSSKLMRLPKPLMQLTQSTILLTRFSSRPSVTLTDNLRLAFGTVLILLLNGGTIAAKELENLRKSSRMLLRLGRRSHNKIREFGLCLVSKRR
jgi:hypothetical protein